MFTSTTPELTRHRIRACLLLPLLALTTSHCDHSASQSGSPTSADGRGGVSGARTISGAAANSSNPAGGSAAQGTVTTGTSGTLAPIRSGGGSNTGGTPSLGGRATTGALSEGGAAVVGGVRNLGGRSGGMSTPPSGGAGQALGFGGAATSGRGSAGEGLRAAGSTGLGSSGTSVRGGAPSTITDGGSAGANAGTPSTVIPRLCRAYWDFESLTNGSIADGSGHAVTLTVNNASLSEGPRGRALALSGSTSSALASSGVIDTTKSFSVSVWVKLDKLDSYATFVSQDAGHLSSFYLQKRSSGLWALTTFPEDSVDATGCITEGAIKPRVGEWYHLVATRNAETKEQRLYVDGMLSGSSKCAGGFAAAGPLVIGRGRWNGEADFASGGLDDLCLVDGVLGPEQVVDLYQQGRPDGKNYLFAYFKEQAKGRGDGLRLAQSHDALYWGAIGGGKVFLPPTVGGKSFRDPHVMRDPNGTFHVVWTTSCVPWAEAGCVEDKGFGHAQSSDLVHFGQSQYVPIELDVEHVWAPETFYDADSDQYMVFWAAPLDSDPGAADPHSIYFVLTKDFATFSAPKVLYSRPNRNFIDATIIKQTSSFVMFLKDEADGQKNIRAVSSKALWGSGAWSADPSAALTGNYGAEGPSALTVDGKIHLFFDKYGDGKYGALLSKGLTDLTAPGSWSDISDSVYFDGVRHGTPIEVPWEVYRAVALKAGE